MAFGQKRKSIYTDGETIYNSNTGALQLGYVNSAAFMKLSPVKDEFEGKKARRGEKMYDYDRSIFFSFNGEELALLKEIFPRLVKGEIGVWEFEHKTGNSVKQLTMGRGIDGKEENAEVFQIYIAELDRDDVDGEPIIALWMDIPQVNVSEEIEAEPAVYTIFSWIEGGLLVSTRAVQHAVTVGGSRGEGNRGGYSGGGGGGGYGNRGGGYSQQGEAPADDYEETPPRPARRPRPGGRSAPRRPQNDEPAFNPDDDIPF